MKFFKNPKECVLTWIIILTFCIGVTGLLAPGFGNTERIIGLISMIIFVVTSIIREENT